MTDYDRLAWGRETKRWAVGEVREYVPRPRTVQGALEAMDGRDYEDYKRELRRKEKHSRRLERLSFRDFDSNDAGHPLGPGMPTGHTERTSSHRNGWMDVVRRDVCAYCGRPGGTVDHIVPQARRVNGIHDWSNYTGACLACNNSKSDTDLLIFLARRRGTVIPRAAGESVPKPVAKDVSARARREAHARAERIVKRAARRKADRALREALRTGGAAYDEGLSDEAKALMRATPSLSPGAAAWLARQPA